MISIIGGAGFIGTHLCQLLRARGIAFEIVDTKPSVLFPRESRIADVTDLASLRDAVRGKEILHLAGLHRDDVDDPDAYMRVNLGGTRNVCTVARERGITRILFGSSVAVYGAAAPGTDESARPEPTGPYGRSKLAAEGVLRDWAAEDAARKLLILRPTVVFGPGNRGNVHRLFEQIARRNFIMIGAGRNRKSMAYIGNVAAFLAELIARPDAEGTINYADAPDMDMATLVHHACIALTGRPRPWLWLPAWLGLALGVAADGLSALTGRRFPISADRVRKFRASTSFSSNAALRMAFVPPYSLEDGLARTFAAEFLDPDPGRPVFEPE